MTSEPRSPVLPFAPDAARLVPGAPPSSLSRVPLRPAPGPEATRTERWAGRSTPPAAATAMASQPDPTVGADYPSLGLRRTAGQVVDGMGPVFDQAYAFSTSAFDHARPLGTVAAHESVPRVSNTFNVSVTVAGTQGQITDAGALEEALVDLLRTAARRQGLGV